jgi:hypothetical protein
MFWNLYSLFIVSVYLRVFHHCEQDERQLALLIWRLLDKTHPTNTAESNLP